MPKINKGSQRGEVQEFHAFSSNECLNGVDYVKRRGGM
jgi:hypothetical protein